MPACVGDDSGSTSEATTPTSATQGLTNTNTDSTTETDSTGSTSETGSTSTDLTSTTDATTTDATTTDGTTTDATTTEGTSSTTVDPTTTSSTDGGFSFAADIYPILSGYCSCHVDGAPAGLAMPDVDTAYNNLVNADAGQAALKRVAPGMPDMSYMMHKIDGTHLDVGGSGGAMPKGNPPLPLQENTDIRDWIIEGAKP
ncbi:MAG TPA: hypothetical protein ENJ18_12725 [Nannocystis exedens]|nr:hypothetical protein [Nannocystis exedens]